MVSGTAFDDVGVAEVRVEIFDRETGWWWNGSGWQASRTYVFAIVDGAGCSVDGLDLGV